MVILLKKNILVLTLLLGLLGGCKQQMHDDEKLHIAAASSLIHLTPSLKSSFEQAFPSCSVEFSLASSGSLYFQIKNGAPFDFFISADQSWAQKAGKLNGFKDQLFAQGALWLWLDGLNQIDTNQAITIANPTTAPHGALAKQWLQEQNLWQELNDRQLIITASSAAKIPLTIQQGGIKQAILPEAMLKGLPDPSYTAALPYKVQYYQVPLQEGKCHHMWQEFIQQQAFKTLRQEHGFDQGDNQ